LTYPTAWDVHCGQATGRCEHTTGVAPSPGWSTSSRPANRTPAQTRCSGSWNESTHGGTASVIRTAKTWPNTHLAHLPAHASWLDQAEIYFSVIQRKALIPNDFTSLDQIRKRLAAFETRYNTIARSFNWKFTRADLHDLMRRIDSHNNAEPHARAA
jgi:hypothetical protein